jgi:predicted nucleotidyltransferase
MAARAAQTLGELEASRNDILSRIVRALEQDGRVVAAWLTGSIGRGEDDAWSDLDLHVAIEDAHLDPWWEAREALYRAIAPPVFLQREIPSNAQEGGHFQLVYFPGPVEVDWNVGPVSLATMPGTSKVLFARRDIPVAQPLPMSAGDRRERLQHATDFFWAMTPIAVKYCGRGATTEAVDQIDLLVRAFTEAWWVVHGLANLSSKNPRLEPGLAARLPVQGSTIDPSTSLAQIGALMGQMTDLKPALEAAGARWPEALVSQVESLVNVARDVIRAGEMPL